jgi:hypothetical protein
MARPDDVWAAVVLLLGALPSLIAEVVADYAEDPEDLLAELQPDLDAIVRMADDPGAPWPFGAFANVLRVVRDRTDAPAATLARLHAFETAFMLLRDLADHDQLPALADETP